MKKVLIVDDEEPIRFLISETLSLNHYEIHQAGDGTEALPIIDALKPDLLILDAIMPEMSGDKVAKIVSAKAEKPVIVMLTASTFDSFKTEALNCGVDYFIKKPFSPMELLELAEKILGE